MLTNIDKHSDDHDDTGQHFLIMRLHIHRHQADLQHTHNEHTDDRTGDRAYSAGQRRTADDDRRDGDVYKRQGQGMEPLRLWGQKAGSGSGDI